MRVCAEVFAILLLQAILPSVLAGCKETTPWHDDDDATGAKVLDRISDDVKSQFDAFTGKSGKSMRNICVYIKTGELKEDIDSSERFSNKADSEGRLEEASQLLLTDYIHREITAVDFGFLKPSKGSYDEGPAHNPHLSRLEGEKVYNAEGLFEKLFGSGHGSICLEQSETFRNVKRAVKDLCSHLRQAMRFGDGNNHGQDDPELIKRRILDSVHQAKKVDVGGSRQKEGMLVQAHEAELLRSNGDKSNFVEELKGIYIVVILLVHLVGGWAPWLFTWLKSASRWLSIGTAFAAGVMITAGFLHLLPRAQAWEAGALEDASYPQYPLAAAFTIVGFLVLAFLDRVVVSHDNAHATSNLLTERGKYDWRGRMTKLSGALVFLAGLIVHSVLAGIGLGLQNTEQDVHNIFGAIVSHGIFEAMAFGVKLIRDGAAFLEFAPLMCSFSMVTSLAIPIGMAINTEDPWVRLSLGGLDAGTFIYLGATDICGSLFTCRDFIDYGYHNRKAEHMEGAEPDHNPFEETPTMSLGERMIRFAFVILGTGVIACSEIVHQDKRDSST